MAAECSIRVSEPTPSAMATILPVRASTVGEPGSHAAPSAIFDAIVLGEPLNLETTDAMLDGLPSTKPSRSASVPAATLLMSTVAYLSR